MIYKLLKKQIFFLLFLGKKKITFDYSNIDNKQDKKIIKLDLRKKLKIKSNTYTNVLIYNVLEHIDDHSIVFKEIKKILNKNGNLFGSTPFLYQVHGAPKDYYRFTKDFFLETLHKNGFKKISIKCMGYGPFVACLSIIQSYTKYLPLINPIIFLICYLLDFVVCFSIIQTYTKYLPLIDPIIFLICFFLDFILQIFVKTKLNEIYPIGIFFSAKK